MTKIKVEWSNRTVGIEIPLKNITKRQDCMLLAQELVIRMDIPFRKVNYVGIYKGIKKSFSMAKEHNIGRTRIYLPMREVDVVVDLSGDAA